MEVANTFDNKLLNLNNLLLDKIKTVEQKFNNKYEYLNKN